MQTTQHQEDDGGLTLEFNSEDEPNTSDQFERQVDRVTDKITIGSSDTQRAIVRAGVFEALALSHIDGPVNDSQLENKCVLAFHGTSIVKCPFGYSGNCELCWHPDCEKSRSYRKSWWRQIIGWKTTKSERTH